MTCTPDFFAMGGEATVAIVGPGHLHALARDRIADLERKWSRFDPTSEISRLNADRGNSLMVSADTRALVRHAVEAWRSTVGAFDPSLLDAIVSWGYDRTLPEVGARRRPTACQPSPGLASVVIDEVAGTVDLGGVGFDPGGIGKGLAADLVAEELISAGAERALVSIGGDLRVAGELAEPGFVVGIEDPGASEQDLLRVGVVGGGLATSSDRRRRWRAEPVDAHHLFDPQTGAPAPTALTGVTVLAGAAWWAEVLTKAVLVGGLHLDELPAHSASAIGRARDGRVIGTRDLLELRWAA